MDEAEIIRQIEARQRRLDKKMATRPRPGARTEDQTRARLLDQKLPEDVTARPAPMLAVDLEIKKLLASGKILEPRDENSFYTARQAVVDGCIWGDYYARFRLGRVPYKSVEAKLAVTDIADAEAALNRVLTEHSTTLIWTIAEPTVRPDHPSSRLSVEKLLVALRGNSDLSRLREIAEAAAKEDRGGTPGNPWRVGFVYGIGIGWVALTGEPISPSSDTFVSFVSQAAATVDDDNAQADWTSAIRTAIAHFGLNESRRHWLHRPGPRDKFTANETPP